MFLFCSHGVKYRQVRVDYDCKLVELRGTCDAACTGNVRERRCDREIGEDRFY